MESACTLRFGFNDLIKSISYTKQSNLFLYFLSTLKRSSRRHCPVHVLIVLQCQRIVVYVLLHDYVNVHVYNLHNPHCHIDNRKQHTADLQLLVALFPSHLVLVQFFGSQTLFIRSLKPNLNLQADSNRAKVFL